MKVNTRTFRVAIMLFVITVTTPLTGHGSEPEKRVKPEKPNIILVFLDDAGYADFGVTGSPTPTPTIDALATNGVQFTQFYNASPVCSASRAALLTGRYPDRFSFSNVLFPDDTQGLPQAEETLAELLKKQGYSTHIFGKWHLGHLQGALPLYEGNEVVKASVTPSDQKMLTKAFTDRAIEVIEGQAGQPFFIYLAYSASHIPIFVRDEIKGKSGGSLYQDVTYEFDLQMARVMKALRDKGVEQDTLVIFTTNAIAQYSDILPTMIDAAGGTAPDDLDGKSLLPLIRGETKVHREKAFFVHNNRHDDRKQDPLFSLRAVTDGRYKLIWNLTPQYMYATKNINGGDDGHLEGEGVRIADTHS